MSVFFYQYHVPFAIVAYVVLTAAVTTGALRNKQGERFNVKIHLGLAILALVLTGIHGAFHLYWNNFILHLPLVLGLIPFVLLAFNLILGLTHLNSKLKKRLHIITGVTALVVSTFHAGWMIAQRINVIS